MSVKTDRETRAAAALHREPGTFRLLPIHQRPGVSICDAITFVDADADGRLVLGPSFVAIDTGECPCGQRVDLHELRANGKCRACRAAARAPQGETVRLFEPAPTQMPGQTSLI